MTTAFTQAGFTQARRPGPQLPTLPTGWPIGSYDSYEAAQRAVDHLASTDFAVADLTIVGVDPIVVERVSGRLTRGKVLASGAGSGGWFGLFVGLLLSMFTPTAGLLPIAVGLLAGIGFGLAFSAISYATLRGRRGFLSHNQLVAQRYDVLCQPRSAEQGRDLLARQAIAY